MGWAQGTCGEGERYIRGLGGGNMRERDHLEDLGVDEVIILRWILNKSIGSAQTGLICLRISGGLL
jgi:hypothetical protein